MTEKTYWLLETRSDDVEQNPEMPIRDPPLFAHMLSKSNDNMFDPVEIHVGDKGVFCFQLRVETKQVKKRPRFPFRFWGRDEENEREEEEEHFYVKNLGPSTILCENEEIPPECEAKCDTNRITISLGKVSLKDIRIENERGLCEDGTAVEGGETQMTFRIIADEGGDPKRGANYLFYTKKLASKPDEAYVTEFHEEWYEDYNSLEREHGFIQWLFPLFLNSGVNWQAHKLGRGEAREIRRDLNAAANVVKSYRLMLNFYGFELADENTGKVVPIKDEKLRNERFENFNYSSHNYLRISK